MLKYAEVQQGAVPGSLIKQLLQAASCVCGVIDNIFLLNLLRNELIFH